MARVNWNALQEQEVSKMKQLANTRVRSAVVVAMVLVTAGVLWFTASSPARAERQRIYPRLIPNDCGSCPSIIEGPGWTCYLSGCNFETGACNYDCFSN
jgi:hypothetical protein